MGCDVSLKFQPLINIKCYYQEVVIEGQDKVLKDVIEPLESISVNMVPTSKQDVRDFGSPQEVCYFFLCQNVISETKGSHLLLWCFSFLVYLTICFTNKVIRNNFRLLIL